jgi:hypothetical protein
MIYILFKFYPRLPPPHHVFSTSPRVYGYKRALFLAFLRNILALSRHIFTNVSFSSLCTI